MKKYSFLMLLAAMCLLVSAACAAPAVTDGQTTGWIAENGYLCIQSGEESYRQIPLVMEDLIQATENGIICQTKDQGVVVVNKDGAMYRKAEGTEAAAPGAVQMKLENGILTVDGTAVSVTAGAMVSDGTYLYYVEKTDAGWILRVRDVVENKDRTIVPGSRDAYVTGLSGRLVDEPESLTVTRDALTLTGKNHRVEVMDLKSGGFTNYPQSSDQTAGACVMNGILYRYTQPEPQKWALENAAAETVSLSATAQPAVQAASVTAAPVVTVAPVVTAAPTKAPAKTTEKTSSGDLIDEDGTVHNGAKGKTVRKIQQRLADLGYPTGSVDGSYGELTQIAIDLFCETAGLKKHNYISPSVQKKLFADDAPFFDAYVPLKKGDRSTRVKAMQKRLKDMRYDPGKADGVYGAKTVAAVALFQRDYGIALANQEIPGEYASREMLETLFTTNPRLAPATSTDIR